jgi:hypothetical protein
MRRTREHTDAHFGHGRECLWRLRAAAVGVARAEREDRDAKNCWKCDESLKSFLFTLKNLHNTPARKFALNAEEKQLAINCVSSRGPVFGGGGDIYVYDDSNANTRSSTSLSCTYTSDTGLDGNIVFTGSRNFQAREIEVFEITD